MESNEDRLGESEGGKPPRKARGGRPRRDIPPASEQVRDVSGEREEDDRGLDDHEEVSDDFGDGTEDSLFAMFEESLVQSVLPDLPAMPGFHVCWLTTSNPRDTIQWRMRIGYQLIRAQDFPDWDGISVKSGDYQGCVGVNEMIAARIPISLYNKYMRHVHEKLPLAEEEKLRAKFRQLKESAARAGSQVEEGDGTAEIVQRARPMKEFAI